jgi:hypothetical protein
MRAQPLPLCDRLMLSPKELALVTGISLQRVRAAIADGTLGPARQPPMSGTPLSLLHKDDIRRWFDTWPVTPSSKREIEHD